VAHLNDRVGNLLAFLELDNPPKKKKKKKRYASLSSWRLIFSLERRFQRVITVSKD
jgi:hypothetical protein